MADIKFERLDITVLSFSPAKVLVKWVLAPTVLPLQDYEFIIERSENQKDGFEHIATIPGNSLNYLDRSMEMHNVHRSYYYRIRAKHIKDDRFIEGPTGTWDDLPSIVAAEMIRLLDWLLDDRTGQPCFYFQEITDKARCPKCWDPSMSRVMDPDCPTCKGTGNFGGYYSPIFVLIDFFPDNKVTQHAPWGESQPNEVDVMISAYPEFQNRGVIIKAGTNKAYRIQNVRPIKEPGSNTIIHQMARLAEINRSDIENTLEVPEEMRIRAANMLRERKKKREF